MGLPRRTVVLYLNEDAACVCCTEQAAEMDRDPAFPEAGIPVLSIVMNPAGRLVPDRRQYGGSSSLPEWCARARIRQIFREPAERLHDWE